MSGSKEIGFFSYLHIFYFIYSHIYLPFSLNEKQKHIYIYIYSVCKGQTIKRTHTRIYIFFPKKIIIIGQIMIINLFHPVKNIDINQ